MNYVEVGEKIRKFRKEKGISQEELAEKVGISVTHMSHIETANTKLSLPVFVSVTEALGVRADDLLNNKLDECNQNIAEELQALLSDCTDRDMRIILDLVKAAKLTLSKNK